MTIKQQGGVFGRNPKFNNVIVYGTLAVDQIVEKTGAAGITLDGVTLKDGNVVLENGKGIDFSATSGTGTSELFDDYEEGTIASPLSVGGTLITSGYSTNNVKYTKVGNSVLVTADFDYTSPAGTGPSGAVTINLPFTPSSAAIIATSVYMSVAIPSLGAAYIFVRNNNGSAQLTQANVNNVYSLSQGERIVVRASATYQTN